MMSKRMVTFNQFETGKIGNLPIHYQAVFVNAMAECGKPREQIADEMNSLLGPGVVTKGKLDTLARERRSKAASEWRFPPRWISPFCEVTGSDELRLLIMGTRLREKVAVYDTFFHSSALLNEIFQHVSKVTGRGPRWGNSRQC